MLDVDACMRRSAFQQMTVTDHCICATCAKAKMKLNMFQNIISLVDFSSGFWPHALQLSLRSVPTEVSPVHIL